MRVGMFCFCVSCVLSFLSGKLLKRWSRRCRHQHPHRYPSECQKKKTKGGKTTYERLGIAVAMTNERYDRGSGTDDLLNELSAGPDIDDTLVDSHLESIPGLGTLTTRRLPGGDAESLGRHPTGTLATHLLIRSGIEESLRDCFRRRGRGRIHGMRFACTIPSRKRRCQTERMDDEAGRWSRWLQGDRHQLCGERRRTRKKERKKEPTSLQRLHLAGGEDETDVVHRAAGLRDSLLLLLNGHG